VNRYDAPMPLQAVDVKTTGIRPRTREEEIV